MESQEMVAINIFPKDGILGIDVVCYEETTWQHGSVAMSSHEY